MRVITLDPKQFVDICVQIRNMTAHFNPDLIVGIPTGGAFVAKAVGNGTPICNIKLQRPSTQKKNKPILRMLMRILPYAVLDRLRIIEAKRLQKESKAHADARVDIPSTVHAAIARASRILILDDAIDSGHTMLAIKKAVTATNPSADVRTAAITVTTTNPAIIPDYCIYTNSTLIRFPWSMDYKCP